jgi:hypothetical protein
LDPIDSDSLYFRTPEPKKKKPQHKPSTVLKAEIRNTPHTRGFTSMTMNNLTPRVLSKQKPTVKVKFLKKKLL